jgi:ribosomal protein S18 acetylase RimI-like enzyme
LSALAIQVFLSTYAPSGVSLEVAREALDSFSERVFLSRLEDPNARFVLAIRESALLGFAEVRLNQPSPAPSDVGSVELARLYVQPGAQRRQIGSTLLRRSEDVARLVGAKNLWLTVWAGNAVAIDFYRASSYRELGKTTFVMGQSSYENLLMAREISDDAT